MTEPTFSPPTNPLAIPTPEVIASVSYTPSRRQIPGLLAALADTDDDRFAANIERALLRQPVAAFSFTRTLLGDLEAKRRGRLTKLLGRLVNEGQQGDGDALSPWLRDADPAVRRAAARSIGKRWKSPQAERTKLEAALLEALDAEQQPRVRASVVEALGRVGGTAAQAVLASAEGPEADAAKLLLRRNLTAQAAQNDRPSTENAAPDTSPTKQHRILDQKPLGLPTFWVLQCRKGLTKVLAAEPGMRGAKVTKINESAGEVFVKCTPEATLAGAWDWRSATGFWLSLRPVELKHPHDPSCAAAQLAAQLIAPDTQKLLRGLTAGDPVRYRLSWEGTGEGTGEGKKRALTQQSVRLLAEAAPWLVNDPSVRDWEVVAVVDTQRNAQLSVRLAPKLPDPRFTYRRGDVPAASHPTLAAALVQVANPQPGEVIWDPFTGSGGEIIECGLRLAAQGARATLWGSDLSDEALAVATQNAAAARITAHFVKADALTWQPNPLPNLIVSNPPMGRRVKLADGLDAFFAQCLDSFGRSLAPSGRLVWYAPRGKTVAALARRSGWRVDLDQPVDMGGFEVHLQVLRRA